MTEMEARRRGMTHERALLGQRVRVTLDESVIVEGQLLGFGEGGDLQILCDDGFVHFAWPMLKVDGVDSTDATHSEPIVSPEQVGDPSIPHGPEGQ